MAEFKIHKGEQFLISVPITFNGEPVTPENVAGVRVQLDSRLCEWPDGELVFDEDASRWNYPLIENQTRCINAGTRKMQVGIKINDNYLYSDVKDVVISDSIIKKRWDNG